MVNRHPPVVPTSFPTRGARVLRGALAGSGSPPSRVSTLAGTRRQSGPQRPGWVRALVSDSGLSTPFDGRSVRPRLSQDAVRCWHDGDPRADHLGSFALVLHSQSGFLHMTVPSRDQRRERSEPWVFSRGCLTPNRMTIRRTQWFEARWATPDVQCATALREPGSHTQVRGSWT
jgi:hypothetical protein